MMKTPNLMDVPSHSTRRIERYGVLALILFLTTFGVLYLWDVGSSTEPSEVPRTASGYQARSTTPPPRVAGKPKSNNLPLSGVDSEQEVLAKEKNSEYPQADEHESRLEREAQQRSYLEKYYMNPEPAAFGGLARGVSVSGYRRGRQERAEEGAATGAPAGKEMEYVVKSGDCLSTIAQRELGSIKHLPRLREVNGLGSDELDIGQRLILPYIGKTAPVRGTDIKRTPPPAASTEARWTGKVKKESAASALTGKEKEYVVKSGDCLSTIAQWELGSVNYLQRLREVNGLGSDELKIGQRLILPHIGKTASVRGADIKTSPPAADTGEWKRVKVVERDSLWKIAARHLGDGERYDEIMRWNNLTSSTLRPGTELRIKQPSDDALTMGGQAQ